MLYALLLRNILPFCVVLILHLCVVWLLLTPKAPQAKIQEPKVLLASLVAPAPPKPSTNKPSQKTVQKDAVAEAVPKPKIKPKTKPVPQEIATTPQLAPEPAPEKETELKIEQKKLSEPVETAKPNTEKDSQQPKHNADIPDKSPNTIETDDDTKTLKDTVVTAIKVDARSTQNHPPVYPKLSKRLKEEGTVVLRLLISSKGQIEEIRIHESSGYARLDKAALSAASKWRYEPATINGTAIAQHYLMPIEFKLNTSQR